MDRTIKVTGRGKTSVTPDMVKVIVTLESKHDNYVDAVTASSELTKELQNRISNIGFNPEELKTSSFNIQPYYDSVNEDGIWRNRLMGYEFRSELVITIENDNKRLSEVITAVTATSGEPRVDIRYEIKDKEQVRERLLTMAVEDSLKKAKVIASSSGVILGDIISVDYSWSDNEIYNQPVALYRSKASCDGGTMSLDISAEDIVIEDQVTVMWEINRTH